MHNLPPCSVIACCFSGNINYPDIEKRGGDILVTITADDKHTIHLWRWMNPADKYCKVCVSMCVFKLLSYVCKYVCVCVFSMVCVFVLLSYVCKYVCVFSMVSLCKHTIHLWRWMNPADKYCKVHVLCLCMYLCCCVSYVCE